MLGSSDRVPPRESTEKERSPSPGDELADLIARMEAEPAPSDEHRFLGLFSSLRGAAEERGEAPSPDLLAEVIAFTLHAHDHQDLSSWGLYFGPMMSGVTPSGERRDSPPLSAMTPEVLAYWRRRAAESRHPVMRARYADLLWELPKKLEGPKPDATMARAAIDAYLTAVEARRYEHRVTAIAKAERALTIALSLDDKDGIGRARDVMLALEDAVAEDASPGLWGFCFDAFVEPPNQRVALSDVQRAKLVDDLEARLARLVAGPPDPYHPAGAEAAALRLAKHYRRLGTNGDVARVLRAYGDTVRRMRGTAAPLVVAHCVEQLYNLFKTFGLNADADELNELLRVVGEESLADMKPLSVESKLSNEEVEGFFTAMMEGSPATVLLRIVAHFIPKREQAETQLRELAKQAPISYLMPHAVMDAEGRTVAHVGPLESDPEGHLVRHISQSMQLSTFWLRESMRRALERGLLSASVFLDSLYASPLFQAKQRAILEAGLDAYVRQDSLAALHILIPQVEQALRQLAILIGAPVYAQRPGGGLLLRTLDTLLRDPAIGEALGADIVTYLRVLLTDARGWNLRNDICHGLASAGMLTMPVADRVVHALLTLSLVREGPAGRP